jgi:hypothetical protein
VGVGACTVPILIIIVTNAHVLGHVRVRLTHYIIYDCVFAQRLDLHLVLLLDA